MAFCLETPKEESWNYPGLDSWELITPSSDLRLRWGLKKTCNSPQDLSNDVSHSTCAHRDWVDTRLLVVGSQTGSLTPGPFFDHNLCCKCPNGSCEEFRTSTLQDLFNDIKHTSMRGVLTPAIKLWVFGSPGGLQVPLLGVWISSSHLPQSGVATFLLFPLNHTSKFIFFTKLLDFSFNVTLSSIMHLLPKATKKNLH
jgi:hypothetical protein